MRFFLVLVVALTVAGSVERSAHPFGDAQKHDALTERGFVATASSGRSRTSRPRAGSSDSLATRGERTSGPRSVSASTHVREAQLTTIRLTLAFACIHRFEGAWDANTGNGYYGGLQMDATFERQYGAALLRRFGHANHWPAADQVAVAIRAFKSGRGFGPWPQTRRSCGV